MATNHVVFITRNRLIKDTPLSDTIDADIIMPVILLAQDKYIYPKLGDDLYNKLKNDIADGSLEDDYKTLVENYIQKSLVQFAFAELLPVLRLKFSGHSVTQMNNEQGNGATYEELKPIMENAINMGEFYMKRMIDYISNKTDLFPEYSSNTGGELSPSKTSYYSNMNVDFNPDFKSNKLKAWAQGTGLSKYIDIC
ncbi:MAG: hypothetical protein Unbinned3987contig1001_6 [Prokaryotic dsDNA virus sp.]|jgi:hypothetical protein|nr:MAG: hypothetical protein Unbinned3987contig1001_6 [Prokaryotic dsDNA virus sp.]|tara:strand:- start:2342 stop:2929 length:588 start_codon:yes stop_codon:yes gene_type:complete